jgi:hypothetical protein
MLNKLFDQIRNSGNPIFADIFGCAEDVFDNFCVPSGMREGIEIVFASYEYEDYSGSATVFFFDSNTGKYYENYGSHCSCYGLEDQWQPEEVCFPELEKRFKGKFFGINYWTN